MPARGSSSSHWQHPPSTRRVRPGAAQSLRWPLLPQISLARAERTGPPTFFKVCLPNPPGWFYNTPFGVVCPASARGTLHRSRPGSGALPNVLPCGADRSGTPQMRGPPAGSAGALRRMPAWGQPMQNTVYLAYPSAITSFQSIYFNTICYSLVHSNVNLRAIDHLTHWNYSSL
jgi:hypothetical protein